LSETIIDEKAQQLWAKSKLLGFMQLQAAIGAHAQGLIVREPTEEIMAHDLRRH
jgi:hypothetical protein